ncbi:MAG: BREX system Lon protease-like protein BrxL [Candidatus Riflebacteria bacterium HGW-Riflebacteria-2]|jgi:ATP-dependent Lon protease|nr:MAG: BREX system Lon protease-like protein BrxL [Candidatus Riflebacteria bacterium HGW-Riflebacteria-2]
MNTLDQKINDHFQGLVVRKDLVKAVKGNAVVPSYVLEYLLGQYCATSDEATIQTGIETVREILRKHYVHRSEANLVRSEIARLGRLKVIDRIEVDFVDDNGSHEASFENLGISKVLIDADTVKKNSKLLVGGVWCIADLEYTPSESKAVCPWILTSLKPIQLSSFDHDNYLKMRRCFSTDEWIDLLMQSIGFNPEFFGKRSKLTQLSRLIPFCERNYNLIELGPKGTGKSHIYSEFSPHGTLVSGGEATLAKLFINNNSGKIGLVGYWDVVALDEFAGKNKKPDIKLIDTLKNYMANKSFNRGTGPQSAEASMVFIGNTSHNVPYLLKHSDLFHDLPENYRNAGGHAILDRLHLFVPGWEMDNLRNELFSDGYGFVVDYLAEVLRSLRDHDFSDRYSEHFSLSPDISTRDRDGINKTFAGLMKLLFPHGEATREEIEEVLKFAIEGRKRVKDQLMRIDATYGKVSFAYRDKEGKESLVKTLEEEEYPGFYYNKILDEDSAATVAVAQSIAAAPKTELREHHQTIQENQRGISFDSLLGPYLLGARKIVITDPYIRLFYQVRNLMEFIEMLVRQKKEDEVISIDLITVEDDYKCEQQLESLEKIKEACQMAGIEFKWEFATNGSIHARHIITDHGWKISLDRGLDIFQHYEMNDALSLTNRLQQFRPCKAFEATFIKL